MPHVLVCKNIMLNLSNLRNRAPLAMSTFDPVTHTFMYIAVQYLLLMVCVCFIVTILFILTGPWFEECTMFKLYQ